MRARKGLAFTVAVHRALFAVVGTSAARCVRRRRSIGYNGLRLRIGRLCFGAAPSCFGRPAMLFLFLELALQHEFTCSGEVACCSQCADFGVGRRERGLHQVVAALLLKRVCNIRSLRPTLVIRLPPYDDRGGLAVHSGQVLSDIAAVTTLRAVCFFSERLSFLQGN